MTDQPPLPERMGLDAIRQAIEERDAMERQYHDLAEQMVYPGNSVSWWHSKATAYRNAIDNVWDALRAAGIRYDGAKTCADGVRELHEEAKSFHMAYRIKCDETTKVQAEDIERLRAALDKIAERTGSDDPCRVLVQIARAALREPK
jgi:hypothetical protein